LAPPAGITGGAAVTASSASPRASVTAKETLALASDGVSRTSALATPVFPLAFLTNTNTRNAAHSGSTVRPAAGQSAMGTGRSTDWESVAAVLARGSTSVATRGR